MIAVRLPVHDPDLRRHHRGRPVLAGDDPGRPAHGRRAGRPGRLAAHVGHDQRQRAPTVWDAFSGPTATSTRSRGTTSGTAGGRRLRGGGRLLRRLHGVADGLPGQVGRVADAGISYVADAKAERRKPDFLFVYAPTSFGWRTCCCKGAEVDGDKSWSSTARSTGRPTTSGSAATPEYNGPDRLAVVEPDRRRPGGDLAGDRCSC